MTDDPSEEYDDDFEDTRPMKAPRSGQIEWPPTRTDGTVDTSEIVMGADVSQGVGVISPEQAQSIRFEHEPTLMEENTFNFTAEVTADGKIEVPERFRKPGGLVAGASIVVAVSLIDSE